MYAASLPTLLQGIVFVEKRYGGTAERYSVHVRISILKRRQVPQSEGELGRGWKVGIGDRQLEPFVPYSSILKRFVGGLDGNGEGLAICPYLRSHIQFEVGAGPVVSCCLLSRLLVGAHLILEARCLKSGRLNSTE